LDSLGFQRSGEPYYYILRTRESKDEEAQKFRGDGKKKGGEKEKRIMERFFFDLAS
jgi:hypothetical protein